MLKFGVFLAAAGVCLTALSSGVLAGTSISGGTAGYLLWGFVAAGFAMVFAGLAIASIAERAAK